MDIKVDKDVPIPPPKSQQKKWAVLYEMEIGDSFLLPVDETRARYASSAKSVSRRTGRKFISRQTEEGIRVWRVR